MILRLHKGRDLPKITILTVLQLPVTAWNDITEETVANCFRKSHISQENQSNAVDDTGDPFKALDEYLTQLRQKKIQLYCLKK